MRSISLQLLAIGVFTALLFMCSSGFHISYDTSGAVENLEEENIILRVKRQLEDLSEDVPTMSAEQQEESTFWDRVVKVALTLFSKFIEWLNS